MSDTLSILMGVGAGIIVISVATYVAVRPYLHRDFSKSSLPDVTPRRDDVTSASNLEGCGDPPGEDA
ncbi:hypothetical protein FM996_01955 [Methylosinus sporium]|uniref:Uncharacterized protein n=1 Tax=Methylosinus sporium TaxID=428 RepID=A0A549T731_METSR|nr:MULTISPECIES: hypothetical protein [Methylosinus]MBU3888240.1 hypothetical protein [Methylosinus sp. KRF6]TRL37646.1 hypothetical protein FM996_01955 [Methylosinus sporium]